VTRTPLSRSKGQRSRSGRCSGDRGNVLSVGIYCYVAVCRCGRLGGARLFGTHRGRRVAGHIVAAPARLVCFDVQFHNVSVMNVKFVCRRVAVACDRVKSLQRFEWRSSIHLDAKVRMLNALGCSSSSRVRCRNSANDKKPRVETGCVPGVAFTETFAHTVYIPSTAQTWKSYE